MNYLRGHKIEIINGVWCYSDNRIPTCSEWKTRPCGHCNKHNTLEGHDACLGTLPKVMNACCGHGQNNEAYVQLLNGQSIHGVKAIELIQDITHGN